MSERSILTGKPLLSLAAGEKIVLGTRAISCDDIAKFGFAIGERNHFFTRRRGVEHHFCSDMNGSGTQCLEIKRSGGERLMCCIFNYWTSSPDQRFLYEADLWKDQRKDYEPTINHGKHRFYTQSAEIYFDWNGDEAKQWWRDIERLPLQAPTTLEAWVRAGVDMLVNCSNPDFWCRSEAVLSSETLSQHLAAGRSLAGLSAKLRCSVCGSRNPSMRVF